MANDSETPKNTQTQGTDADRIYGAINKYISDTGFEFAMQDGRIDDGELAQIAAQAGLKGVNVEALLSIKARFEQSWQQEHKDGPDKGEPPYHKEAAKEGDKMLQSGASLAEEVSPDKSVSSLGIGQGKNKTPGIQI